MKIKTLLIVVTAVIALSAGLFARLYSAPTVDPINNQLTDFKLPDLNGKLHSISEWQGKVLIINFWATWCPPCRKEIPEFVHLQKLLSAKGLQFVGIAIEGQEPVNEFVDGMDINYPILIGEDTGIDLSYQLGNVIRVLPYSVVVNRQGQIIHRQQGEFSKTQILKIIDPIL